MKGLLIKDFRILLHQKNSLFIILVVGMIMAVGNEDISSGLGYMMVVSSMLVVTTISYDYFEKGMTFILTLPICRRDYVLEKYVLAVLIDLAVAVIGVLMQFVSALLGRPVDWKLFIGGNLGCMIASAFIIGIYIPIFLKFGPEKSRTAMFVIFGAAASAGFAVSQITGLQTAFEQLMKTLNHMSAGQVFAAGGFAFLAFLAASILISVGILEKKEF